MDVKLSTSRQLSPVFETGGRLDLDILQPVLEQHAAAMVEDARTGWPVDTGTSRDAWEAEIEISEGQLLVALINEARLKGRGYSVYIHRPRSPRLVWTEVQERLTLNLLPALQADIALAISESMRG